MKKTLGLLLAGSALSLLGCVQPFIYNPPTREANAPHFPYKVAVMGFEDGTEDFVQTGGHVSSPWAFNLVKGGGSAVGLPQLTTDVWAKSFADDLQQANMFEDINLLFSRTALTRENIIIQGTILRSTLAMHTMPCEFSVKLTATRPNQDKPFWEGTFTQRKLLQLSSCPSQKCGLSDVNEFLQGIFKDLFSEARKSLADNLKSPPSSTP